MKKLRSLLLMMMALLMITATACNDAATPEAAVKSFNSKMNACDYKGAFDYVQTYDGLKFDSGDKTGTRKIVDAVAKTLEMDIVDISTSGATGVAVLNITTVDLRYIYKNSASVVTNNYVDSVLAGSKISGEDMRKALIDEISKESAMSESKKVTTECRINLIKEKDKWYMILDTNSFNIIMGYIDEANAMVQRGDFGDISVSVSNSDATSGQDDTSSVTFND